MEANQTSGAETSQDFGFREVLIILCSILTLIILIFTVKCVWIQAKCMSYWNLKYPPIVFIVGVFLFQFLNIISIASKDITILVLFGIEKLYLGIMILSFYYLVREFVFFETLFKQSNQHNIHVFTSESNDEGNPFISGRRSSGLRQKLNQQEEKKERLREKLITVPFDRAYEEEAILNTVFPTAEIKNFQKPLSEQKVQSVDIEVFEIGRVARCFEFCAYEYFETQEDASQFRKMSLCSIIAYFVATIVTSTIQYLFQSLNIQNLDSINVDLLLISIHLLFTFYMLYSIHVYALCLSQGMIQEYEPLNKYYWIMFNAIVVVIQPQVINLVFMLINQVRKSRENQKQDIDKSDSLLTHVVISSVEFIMIFAAYKAHFIIKQEQHNQQYSYYSFQSQDKQINNMETNIARQSYVKSMQEHH